MKNFIEKLNDIVDMDIERKKILNNIEEICVIEKSININFSETYKYFLLNYASCFIKDTYYFKSLENNPLTPTDGFESVGIFFGKDLLDEIELYGKEMNNQYIPIAESDGGDMLCIGIGETIKDKVYFWSHDDENKFGKRFFLVANSFEQFIMSFEEKKKEKIDLSKVKITLDPSLF